MAIEIYVPDIGADEVEVTEILVKVGDKVAEEQSLITVEGDKASMEVPASQAGIVKEIKVVAGDKVSTGSLIMVFEAEGAAAAAPAPAPQAAAPVAAAPAAAALKEVQVPDIGGDEVEVTEIMVKVGDVVAEEQSLITVEGDKASMEVPAPFAGTVKEIKIAAGDKVSTGSLIMVFEVAGAAPLAAPVQAAAPAAAAAPAVAALKEVQVPDIGGDEVTVTEIMVNVGDSISEEQSLITVEGDKASMEVPAPFAGTLKEIKVAAGDKVKTGSLIMVFEVAGAAPVAAPAQAAVSAAAPAQAAAPAAAPAASGEFQENHEYSHASPVVRRLAREFGVNLAKVKGSGRKNRILKEDVQNYVKEALKRLESGAQAAASGKGDGAALGLLPWPKVDFSKFGDTEVQPLSRIKKISGANLHRNWVMIPHVTQWDNADITELEKFRQEQNAMEAKRDTGMKITPLVFIMKAAAKALEAFPAFNSSLSDDGESLILKKYVNIGIAVDTPNGLVVPVFKDVNKKGIYELSKELAEVSKKARGGKLTAADMQGGCFTISSLGGIGGTAFTPIVNAPEVAILGVSKSEMKPVWNGKEFAPRLQLPLSLSYDHRVIDGAEGARFITYLNECLSDIRRLVL
ncbi:dihydrolipoyllysine-residue acetyltransferase E2 component of pyruvate dehydrogenase complex [Vibrio cholerae HC-51A1]|uniref:pyruvate dehydrogenase complex dihydrolipoyllysine-residue acetyltransferase n=1 Tax=Vibrio cholerae TaxID=666 RepID=UPI00021AA6BC|nr:pyruvate dehydrogenase complex dihydrolipoyllysine-residue acetyltransferase [Vibrio cholerae]EGS60292.1 dihydrolipoyllysine-residue acetyltransferase E2 component of pyruvate dehydrogenase complex [Vibrio cholerae HC-02A1]EII5635069.1 pyruvate dehydrogenase complex dihydrolipoyllysine-residue acetyltransferase [Vibrio cholerae]EIN5951894.1 pyruvate dehydrogenase complex dihydrolipoyllysine-residue acetyltransferase [Vibrio cholerae]EIV0335200.1 pyruvate dehydrogenase complex dihydrolipoylly